MDDLRAIATAARSTAGPVTERRAPLRLIGVASGVGAPDSRCADGPALLRREGLLARLRHAGVDAAWSATIAPPAGGTALAAVAAVAERLARRTADLAARNRLPIVIGGDHSCAIGTWKGIARGAARREPLGLIWIDAHMDAHTPETTPSGRLHGMPLACLLGCGDPRLTGIGGGTPLDPRRVCLVGVRSFEKGEAGLLARLGVRVFYMDELARRGLPRVMADAVALAGNGGTYGISLDLDALDPRDAPGVGSPVAGGIRGRDLLRALSHLACDPALAGLEIVEYHPHNDRGGATARLVEETIRALFAPGPAPANEDRYAAGRGRPTAA